MDRCDADQEGTTLPPSYRGPGIGLTQSEQIRLIAEAAARQVIIEHISLCPFAKTDVEKRLRALESNMKMLIGFMLGSGLLGGAAGAAITKLLG